MCLSIYIFLTLDLLHTPLTKQLVSTVSGPHLSLVRGPSAADRRRCLVLELLWHFCLNSERDVNCLLCVVSTQRRAVAGIYTILDKECLLSKRRAPTHNSVPSLLFDGETLSRTTAQHGSLHWLMMSKQSWGTGKGQRVRWFALVQPSRASPLQFISSLLCIMEEKADESDSRNWLLQTSHRWQSTTALIWHRTETPARTQQLVCPFSQSLLFRDVLTARARPLDFWH